MQIEYRKWKVREFDPKVKKIWENLPKVEKEW